MSMIFSSVLQIPSLTTASDGSLQLFQKKKHLIVYLTWKMRGRISLFGCYQKMFLLAHYHSE